MGRAIKDINTKAVPGSQPVGLVTKADIVASLPKLSRSDLMAVCVVANHLAGATGAIEQGADLVGQALFDALQAAVGAPMAYSGLATDTARRFRNATPVFVRFLDENFKGWNKNKVVQAAFLRMLFGLIVNDLKSRGVTPSVGIIVVNMGRISGVFENSFPAYLASGLGPVILKGFQNDRADKTLVEKVASSRLRKRLSPVG